MRSLFRGTVVLALAALAACGKNQSTDDTVQTVRSNLIPDETGPIGQKWRKLVDAGVPIGEATTVIQAVPGYSAQYQPFAQGVIVWTNDFGAVYLTQAIFDKWQSMTTLLDKNGNAVYNYFGVPRADYVSVPNTSGPAYDYADFTAGRVIAQGVLGRAIYGDIYLKYMTQAAALGIPVNEESNGPAGSRLQIFWGGEIYAYSTPIVGNVAYTVFDGPIMWKFHTFGVATTGLPIGDTGAIVTPDTKVERGQFGRFQNGAIYYPTSGNAYWVRNELNNAYERQGGLNGWLGFPTSDSTVSTASGFQYNDFEQGILVWHGTNPDNTPMVDSFGDIQIFIQRITALGGDCFLCGSPDLYYYRTLGNQNGIFVGLNNDKVPAGDAPDVGSDHDDFNNTIGPAQVASHLATFTVKIVGWESDSDSWGGDDDKRGEISHTFNIDNLWGLNENSVRQSDNLRADFSIKSSHKFQENDFRGQKYWAFHNFKTANLKYDQFADSFVDVDPNEAWYWNPFNAMFFELFYRGIAENGNCLGMNVEQHYASLGRSRIGMPIHDAYSDNQDGRELDQALHPSLTREINVKQGMQLGMNEIEWVVGRFLSGSTHDPGGVYNASQILFNSNNPPTIAIYDDVFFGSGHSLKPYRWDGTRVPCGPPFDGDQCARIFVADPNHPTKGEAANADGTRPSDRFILIRDDGSEFFYDGGKDKDGVEHKYQGGQAFGGRMFYEPASIFQGPQVTPFGAPWQLVENAYHWIVGSNGSTKQISDYTGRTVFQTGISGIPTRWDQFRMDSGRLLDIAPMMLTDQKITSNRPMLWSGKGIGSSHIYEITPAPGVAAGAPIEALFHSGALSSKFSIPATLGQVDTVSAIHINMWDKTTKFALPAGGQGKAITWTVSGAEKQRWAEFSNLAMVPAQGIWMDTANAGRKVNIFNDGPSTSAHLRAKGGPGGTVVDLGTVVIPGGSSVVDLQGPNTTLTMGGVVNGQNGWLIAPVTVTLDVQDRGGYGIKATEYSNDKLTWTKYTGPFQYAQQGVTTLYYRSRDNDGNVESPKSQVFKIDSQLPSATGSVNIVGSVTLTYAVTDPTPGSGVAGVHVVQGTTSNLYTPASGTVPLASGCSAVEFWGEDIAGNQSTPHVNLADSVPPVFTTVPPATITTTLCTVAAGLNIGTAAATDDCGSVTVTNDAPAKFPLGTTIVTWTAKDAVGNKATKTTVVTTDLGDDVSCCPAGTNIIKGTSNNDTLNGTAGADCILGLNGQDIIRGNGGNDAISGGGGDDEIWGGDGNDWLAGALGQDKLHGDNGNDTLSGGDGDDTCWGGNNDDRLIGGQGQDNLQGEAGNDTLEGNAGYDTMNGGTGNDFLRGGTEIDNLNGGGGTDQCVQDGADNLTACIAVAP